LKAIAFNSASFFLQVATEVNVSTAVYDKVKYSQSWKVNGACNDATKLAKCSA